MPLCASKAAVAAETPTSQSGPFVLAPVYVANSVVAKVGNLAVVDGLDEKGKAKGQLASVRVVVRVRPIISREANDKSIVVQVVSDNQVSIRNGLSACACRRRCVPQRSHVILKHQSPYRPYPFCTSRVYTPLCAAQAHRRPFWQ